jgi:phosphatidylserine/phosphatidylglycerophosphate/cardiolipin synthase-like enzyme
MQHVTSTMMYLKAKYPLPSTCYLWMIPDHTGLLEEGEAYVAIRDPSIKKATHCLAMRSPSYFLGDMRKLKLVNDKALEDRAKGLLDGQDKLKFFGGLEIGLVLSTKGQVCEADAMSGGDHDGDKAWVCWYVKETESCCSEGCSKPSVYLLQE